MNTIRTESKEGASGKDKDTFSGERYQQDVELSMRNGATASQAARLAGNLWEARNFGVALCSGGKPRLSQ